MKDEIRIEFEPEKMEFEEPEIEIIEFSGSDIVTASGDIDVPIIDPPGGGGEDIDTPIFDDEDYDEGGESNGDESYDDGGDESYDEGGGGDEGGTVE